MRKLRRLIFRLLFLALIIILAVVIFNTLTFASRQIAIDPIAKKEVSGAAAMRLASSIQIPTISVENEIDTAAFIKLHQFLTDNYPLVDSLLEKRKIRQYSLIYKWPGKNTRLKPILLLAHLDVVPVEENSKDRWTQDAFKGIIADGYIWGRGSLDDKVSVLGILEAIELLLKEGYYPERSIYLAFGHDEEIGGSNGAELMANNFKDQEITFEYVLDEGMVILKDALPGLSKPVALVGISEKGYMSLNLEVQLEKGGHSSMPPTETAIGILGKAISALEQNPFPAKINGATKALFDHVGPEMNFFQKAVFANMWLFKGLLKRKLSAEPTTSATIRTTTAPTMLSAGTKDNVMPTDASVTINFRILPGEDMESVIARVKEVINDDRIVVAKKSAQFSNNPSRVSSTDAFGFEVIQKTVQEIYSDVIVAPALAIATTDSRYYDEVSENVYRFLPLLLEKSELKSIHGINERIKLEAYNDVIRFYYQLIKNSCK